MSFKAYATPHSHPASLDSASTPEAFAKREVELGGKHLTCTDHGSLAAIQQIMATAKEHKLIAIPGLESYFRDDACPILQRLGIPRTDDRPKGMDKDVWAAEHPNGAYVGYWKYSHATLHFMDYQAYLCAVRLLSKADARAERHGLERKPIFSWSDIEELASHNITIGSSCLIGLVSRHLMQHRNYDAATAYFERIHHLFGDRMYVEVFPHVCSHNYEKKVFCTVEDSAGKQSTMEFKFEKRLRTDHNEPEGVFAEELSKAFSPGQYTHLTEVKNYRKWEPLSERYRLVNVERKEGLLQNECTEFSPDGDLQKGCNRFALDMAKKHKVPVLISDDCIVPGTLIRCEGGYKPIEDVRPGDTVITHTGQNNLVEATRGFRTGKELVSISVGGDPIEMTVDHKVWCHRSSRWPSGGVKLLKQEELHPEWVLAGEIQKGDLVYVPRQGISGTSDTKVFDLRDYISHKYILNDVNDSSLLSTKNNITGESCVFRRMLIADTELAWLCGFFLGDGNAHNNLASFVSENEIYATVRSKLLALCEKMNFSWDETTHKNHSTFRIVNTAFAQFMRKSFYDYNKNKRIPEWFSDMSPTWIRKVCSGLFNADGSSPGLVNSSYTLSMTSVNVVGWVREMCLALGVYCSISSRMTTGATKRLFTVTVPHEAKHLFGLWGETRPREKSRWLSDGSGFWIRVHSVEKTGAFKVVYDLQVAGTGSFCTSGFAVHNSHFAHADEKTVQDVRLAQDHWTPFANSYHRQSSEESWAYFQEHLPVPRSEFEGWIENSLEWGSRFKNFKLDTTPSLPTKFYPIDSLGTTKELIQHYGRFEKRPEYLERLRTELEILHRNGVLDLLPYFQIDEDVCRFYENQGWITGIGRGSGGGLLLAYLLGITHVDPLKYGLSLERFITLDRIKSGKLADLDQDLPFRDPLTGQTTDVVEVEMEDGTKHILPEDLKIETNLGLLTPAQAIASGADIKKWWLDR